MMASTPCSLMIVATRFWSPVSPTISGTLPATAQSKPVDRLSSTTARSPAATSA